ncbi:MAG: hypothetical protein SWO11_09525 [Thermodesulfobacteriota bacterium]|nr:hypothetical protein [Thermodesulfobacteriota bacterium]
MEERIIETFDLGNNTVLQLIDASRKLVGDRYLVTLVSRITISIKEDLLCDVSDYPGIDDIVSELGDTLIYEKKEERIFVDEREKDSVLNGLLSQFKDNALKYYRHPSFIQQFILKKFREKQKVNQCK